MPGENRQGLMIFFVQSAAKENLNKTRVLYKLFPISRKPCGEILNFFFGGGGERGGGISFTYCSLFSTIVLSVFEIFFYLAATFLVFPPTNLKIFFL